MGNLQRCAKQIEQERTLVGLERLYKAQWSKICISMCADLGNCYRRQSAVLVEVAQSKMKAFVWLCIYMDSLWKNTLIIFFSGLFWNLKKKNVEKFYCPLLKVDYFSLPNWLKNKLFACPLCFHSFLSCLVLKMLFHVRSLQLFNHCLAPCTHCPPNVPIWDSPIPSFPKFYFDSSVLSCLHSNTHADI